MAECKHTAWAVVQSPTDPEMYAVEGIYLVADHLPIEDARLISAAPELLEVLKATLSDFAAWCEIRGGTGTYQPAMDRIQAAISKAEGRSHD